MEVGIAPRPCPGLYGFTCVFVLGISGTLYTECKGYQIENTDLFDFICSQCFLKVFTGCLV